MRRTINDTKNEFKTKGNTNGVYEAMIKTVHQESRERFDRKPWYLICKQREGILSNEQKTR